MSVNEVSKNLLLVYGAVTATSLAFNRVYSIRRHNKAFAESKRQLKYRDDLSSRSEIALYSLERFNRNIKRASAIMSAIPVIQVLYTGLNIITPNDFYTKYWDKQIEKINKIELETRREFLEQIKSFPFIPEDMEEKMKDEEYLPSETEYRDVMMQNIPENGMGLILMVRPFTKK